MAERLVDVLDGDKTVLHTYPNHYRITTYYFGETEYRAKAVKAAAPRAVGA
jgi:hypothetical protein